MDKTPYKHITDELDRQILAILRADGRAPLSKIADILGITRGTVQKRLDRLTDTGIIQGFTVRVREDAQAVHAIMMIEIKGAPAPVVKAIRQMTGVEALYTTNGHWDLVVSVVAASLVDFERVIKAVRLIEGVANSETTLLFDLRS